MSSDALNDLDYTHYARWLRRITGIDYDWAVVDAGGVIPFTSRADSVLPGLVPALLAGGFAWPCTGDGMQRHDLDADGGALLYLAIDGQGGRRGYLAVRATAQASLQAWDALAETLEDIGAGVKDDLAARVELDTMAQELAELRAFRIATESRLVVVEAGLDPRSEALRLRDAGKSTGEIVTALGQNRNTVKSWLRRSH